MRGAESNGNLDRRYRRRADRGGRDLENGERYATEIAQILKIPNNTLFYHLNQLLAANLIATRISGRKTFYSLKSKTFKAISDYFENYYKIIAEKEKENEMLNPRP